MRETYDHLRAAERLTRAAKDLWERLHDPLLDPLRQRLQFRLLLITAAMVVALIVLRLERGGMLIDLGLTLAASITAMALLSRSPRYSRNAAQALVLLFIGAGLYDYTRSGPPGSFPWSLTLLMVLPVFGVLLDGPVSGGLAALTCMGVALHWMLHGPQGHMMLVVLFAAVAGGCFYVVAMAHAWIFGSLVRRRLDSSTHIQRARQASAELAGVLAEQARDLAERMGPGADPATVRDACGRLLELLGHARQKLPEGLPRGAVDPDGLLDQLRRDVHRIYLGLALLAALIALVAILVLGLPLWQLAAILALALLPLTFVPTAQDQAWRGRFRLFIGLATVVMAADVALSRDLPPSASLIFLPLLVYYVGMLDSPRAVRVLCLAGLALLAAANWYLNPFPGLVSLYIVIGLDCLLVMAISLAVQTAYRRLVQGMIAEEEALRGSLQEYRKAASTLFHDLAGPLAVLQGLSSLPAGLSGAADAQRAGRMVQRIRSLTGLNEAPGPERVEELAASLLDLFQDQFSRKGLRWGLDAGAEVRLPGLSASLRDSVLGNLLSNAIKYSPEGGRIILRAESGPRRVRLVLVDEGPGFPADVLDSVAGGQTPRSRPGSRGEQGSGFGLLLAAAYVREAGGQLNLRNLQGGGASAEILLPC